MVREWVIPMLSFCIIGAVLASAGVLVREQPVKFFILAGILDILILMNRR